MQIYKVFSLVVDEIFIDQMVKEAHFGMNKVIFNKKIVLRIKGHRTIYLDFAVFTIVSG